MKRVISVLVIISVLLLSACQKEPAGVGGGETQTGSMAGETVTERGTEPETAAGAETGATIRTESGRETESGGETGADVGTEAADNRNNEGTYSFREVNYCYNNGLDYESVYAQDDLEYIKIDGLKDEQVQKKINDRLAAAAEELYKRDLPPYRGIKVMMPDEEQEHLEVNVYSYVYYNQANILSVLMRKTLCNSDYTYYIEDVAPLTFNLHTGNEITLADLFAEGYDYQSVISEYVRTCISENLLDDLSNGNASEYSGGYSLLKPFETIRENQKFIISTGNEIYLLLDYENREFDVGTMTGYLPVDSWLLPEKGREFAYTYKYETWDSSLYQAGFDRTKFLKTDPDLDNKMWVSDNPQLENVQFRAYMPRSMDHQQLYQRFLVSFERMEERVLSLLEEKQFDQDSFFGGDYSFSVNKYGRYVVESERYSFWNNEEYVNDSFDKVYDGVTGEEITLADCFVPGVDYRELIISLAMEDDSSLSRPELVRCLKEPEFVIYPSYLMISFLQNDASYGLYKGSFYIDFIDIGEENLVVFD